jgi:hypothetical protein
MKITWCWRCQVEYPMLEDHEWAVLMDAHAKFGQSNRDAALDVIKRYAAENGFRTPVEPTEEHAKVAVFLWHLIAGFELFTGVLEDSPNPIWHHYTSHYGPPCSNCGKPLRTKRASYCAACGQSKAPK